MAGTVEWQASEDAYVSAERASYRVQLRSPRPWYRLAMVVSVVAGGGTLLFGLFYGNWAEAGWVGLLGALGGGAGLAIIIAGNYLMLPRRIRRLVAQQRTAQGLRTMTWDDAGASWTTPHGSQRIPWADYHGWVETRGEFLLYLNEQIPHFVPRPAFADAQAQDLRATLVAHGPPRR